MRENMANPRLSKVWNNARIIGASCKDAFNPNRTSCLYFLVQFDSPTGKKNDWIFCRALPRDGLVAVALQREGQYPMMASIFVWQVKSNLWLDSPGGPVIGLILHHANDVSRALRDVSVNLSISEEYTRMVEALGKTASPDVRVEEAILHLKERFLTYTMTETSDSFFSYRPVLGALKDEICAFSWWYCVFKSSWWLQFCIMPSDSGGVQCNLDKWSSKKIVECTSLDDSQAEALHQALTSHAALVHQGPPGYVLFYWLFLPA